MEGLYLILALLVQGAIVYAEKSIDETEVVLQEFNSNGIENEILLDEVEDSKNKWSDIFIGPNANLYPSSSAALMAQATFSDKSPEEQLDDIKHMANEITMLIQNEMANLLSLAIGCVDKGDKMARKKRSIETPMDSTQLIMRLLQHIKSINDYQNIAIEKMMTAQEIADKYGIPFEPDTEILSELAKSANEHAMEMTSILQETCDLKNKSQCNLIEEPTHDCNTKNASINDNILEQTNDLLNITIIPLQSSSDKAEQKHEPEYLSDYHKYYYNTCPEETQIQSPIEQYPVSSRPTFYDTISYNPMFDYPYCSLESMNNVQYLNDIEFEPILTAEEYEETVCSKVFIEHSEPGAGTVNHVTTYSLSEKAHFKTPDIDSLPQQMQYYFLLV